MPIYTKTGDAGTTSLANNERVSKADERLNMYGTADELNSFVGLLRAALPAQCADTDAELAEIQSRLFDLGAALACAKGDWIGEKDTHHLEQRIDVMQATLQPLRAFVLPAGNEVVARCHVCRTVTRRLERAMVAFAEQNVTAQDDPKMAEYRRYVNRLSDYFFVLSRYLGEKTGAEVSVWG